ncbi:MULTISPECIES: hypothetical protein [unclassified Paraburkholderia]|uniref:hypothetical protein n=1 Tax=unclassified Paraburkholderia TaxID=2615204 RepID=UPI002AB15EC9|nr:MULTISPECIES: hypothetical protein [unclassified Paraburkholderia]
MAGNASENEGGPQDFSTSQFSADEMRALFAWLGVDFATADEDKRRLAVARLAEVLRDEAQTDALMAELQAVGQQTGADIQRREAFEPLQKRHPVRSTDRELLDDPASVGKVLDAVVDTGARRTRIHEASDAGLLGYGVRGGGVVHAPLSGTTIEEGESAVFSRSGVPDVPPAPEALLQWTKFAFEVDHVLKAHETLWGRLVAFFHRSNMISRWEQTNPAWLDLHLQEGHRRWLFQIHFGGNDDCLLLIVSGHAGVPLRVPARDPHEFSKLLIDAFDGDINPARLALTSVQQAIEASTTASLH